MKFALGAVDITGRPIISVRQVYEATDSWNIRK